MMLLRLSGLEALFVRRSLERWLEARQRRPPTAKGQRRFQRESSCALRTTVLRRILGEGHRGMSRRLAECPLFQWLVGVRGWEEVRVPSNRQVQR